jgi:hypothetical protein
MHRLGMRGADGIAEARKRLRRLRRPRRPRRARINASSTSSRRLQGGGLVDGGCIADAFTVAEHRTFHDVGRRSCERSRQGVLIVHRCKVAGLGGGGGGSGPCRPPVCRVHHATRPLRGSVCKFRVVGVWRSVDARCRASACVCRFSEVGFGRWHCRHCRMPSRRAHRDRAVAATFWSEKTQTLSTQTIITASTLSFP